MSTYIIVRATQEEEIKNTSAYNPNESRKEAQINLQPSKPQARARIKIRKKSNIPADPDPKTAEIISNSTQKTYKKSNVELNQPRGKNENSEDDGNDTELSNTKLYTNPSSSPSSPPRDQQTTSSDHPNKEDHAIPQPGNYPRKKIHLKEEEINIILVNIPEIKGTFSSSAKKTYEKNNNERNQSRGKNENSEEDENETELSNTKLYTNPSSSPSSPSRDQQAVPSNYPKKEVDPKEEEVNLIVLNTSEIEGTLSSSTPDVYKKRNK